jgi:hypothetical protein
MSRPEIACHLTLLRMNKKEKKKRIEPLSRTPFKMRSDVEMVKIVKEIQDGLIGILPAAHKYGLCRNTLKGWMARQYLRKLDDVPTKAGIFQMTDDQQNNLLLKKVNELTKALAHSQLKVKSLEIMIQVAEEDLHIKIKKKPGTKPSKE